MQKNDAIVAVKQNAVWAIETWEQQHLSQIAKAKQTEIQVLLIGDSITQCWQEHGIRAWQKYLQPKGAFNLGCGGDRVEHVLWRIQNGAVENMSPKLIVLLIGTNNTGHHMDKAEHTAAGIAKAIEELTSRLPMAKILLLAIFPRHYSLENEMRQRNDAINGIINNFADDESIFYLDVNHIFLQQDGSLRQDLMPDLLHLNAAGYDKLAEQLNAEIENLL